VLKQIINQDQDSKSAEGNGDSASGAKNEGRGQASDARGGSRIRGSSYGSSRNILSSDVEIKGKLRFANELVIDGRIEGEVNSEGDLTVGENAHIQGNINTRSVVVYGKVHGNITVSDRCELKQNAELHGDVSAGKLAIEEGASFMGSSAVGPPSNSASPSLIASAPLDAPAPSNEDGQGN